MGNASFKNRKILDPKDKETTSVGNAVAISGNTVVVGCPGGDKCYVFIKESGEFKYLQTLESDNEGGRFGTSVTIDGAHIVVGALGENDFAGRAYVFTKRGNKFVRNSDPLVSGDPQPGGPTTGGRFGASVAIDGAHIVVGAPGENEYTGRAYVFTKQIGKFVRNSEPLVSEHPKTGGFEAGGQFGVSVAINGANIVVGAPYENGFAGRAYVFTKKGNKFVRNSDPLVSGNPKTGGTFSTGGNFGNSVAIDGVHIVVGALYENDFAGRAYVFTKKGNKFVRNSGYLESENPKTGTFSTGEFFGKSVAIDGAHIVVGAYEIKNEDGTIIGRAYTFTKQGTKFVRNSEPLGGDNPPVGKTTRFGASVAIDGSNIVVEDWFGYNEEGIQTGKTYTFTLSV